jgi:5-methylcytosine-specific restriction endonuclease McrA
MTTVATAFGTLTLPDRGRTPARGYARTRREYDARRRRRISDPSVRAERDSYRRLVRGDPCGLCIGVDQRHPQIAADHIVPLDSGGSDRWDNLSAACRRCNAAKKGKALLLFLLERDV